MSQKYLKASSVYIGTTLLCKAIPFLMLPVLTHLLTPDQYGYIGLYITMFAIGGAYVGLRPEVYLIREHAVSDDAQFDVVRRAVIIILIASMVFFLPIALLAAWWILPSDVNYLLFGAMVTLACGLHGLYRVFTTELQISLDIYKYASLELVLVTVGASLSLFFVYSITASWISKALAEIAALIIVVFIGIYYLRRQYFRSLTLPVLPEVIRATRFLWPLTFHIVGFAAINMADRIIIGDLMGPSSVGLYTVPYMFGMIIGICHDAFLKAWNPFFYQTYQDPAKRRWLVKLQVAYLAFSIFGLFAFTFVAPSVYLLLVDEKYHSSVILIPYIALGYTLEGCRKIICGYLYVFGKTRVLAVITFSSALVNVALNYVLIPEVGLLGAAYATIVSFSLMFTLVAVFSAYYLKLGRQR